MNDRRLGVALWCFGVGLAGLLPKGSIVSSFSGCLIGLGGCLACGLIELKRGDR